MQPSRRFFLFGRGRAGSGQWGRFCQRLRVVCAGRFDEGGTREPAQAWLAPARFTDVLHARALCEEYGVRLALAGQGTNEPPTHSTLWVDPGLALNAAEPLQDRQGFWRVEAGCAIGQLQAAGFAQFDGVSGAQTVAAWLSGPDTRGTCLPGRCLDSGVAAVEVLLADGSRATLGPFGERDSQPLRSATLQRLVPALFELAMEADTETCLNQAVWRAHGRLDALRPRAPAGINLAHLLLGQAGSFAWAESLLLVSRERREIAALQHANADADAAASRIQSRCKALFDPQGLFPPLPSG